MNNATEPIGSVINDSVGKLNRLSKTSVIDEKEAERNADWLVEKLGYGFKSRNYYFRVACQLPRQTLERLADMALEVGDHPGKLFTYLTKKEISKIEGRNED